MKVIDLCTDCVQVITNPICPYCFSRQVITWMRDKNLPEHKMRLIRKYLKKLVMESELVPSDTGCIICGAKRVNLCIYCFTRKASRIIGKSTQKSIAKNFDEDFSTEIWRVQH